MLVRYASYEIQSEYLALSASPSECFRSFFGLHTTYANSSRFQRIFLCCFIIFPFAPVSQYDVSRLKEMFEDIDEDRTGMIFCSELLKLVGAVPSPFTDHIFKMIGKA